MFRGKAVALLLFVALVQIISASQNAEDRLKLFYERINKSDAKYCPDKSKLLPQCNECIPGLQKGSGSETCNEFISTSKKIRDEIKKLTDERYGDKPVIDRPFGLYPYLEKPDFMSRQITFGKMMSSPTAGTPPVRNVMDIGAYYNPINLFLSPEVCPESVTVIEPILNPLSVSVPCASDPSKHTHIMFLPVTFKYYMTIAASLPKPETVVCIGCDSHYGPNRKMLETAFDRPYTLYLEYPSEYVHNAPFRKMNGEDKGEELTFIRKFQPRTNETQYTKRVMKVIHYTQV
mmetsp:Transcript_4031/g.6745  ORF Transcript_4031/g.6745 Transcript_4031/m.6745 type:complete len:290 (-) Transcript_4031:194-1063(-)